MKVEAFPTEVRVTAFAIISMVAKVLCAMAPTLIEVLKGSEKAASWSAFHLNLYIGLLGVSVLLSGGLATWVPSGEAKPLKDYVTGKGLLCESRVNDGSIAFKQRDY